MMNYSEEIYIFKRKITKMETKTKTLEEKTCVFQHLGKPYKGCPDCNRYDDKCPDYVPMVETDIERMERIRRQLNLKYI